MDRYLGWFLAVVLCCAILLALNNWESLGVYVLNLSNAEPIYDVMLDPGHGGIDPGAIGAGELYEKHYVLDIVLELAELLRAQGLKVGLTREQDCDVSHLVEQGTRHRRDLLGRFQLMNQAKMGLSVHANSTRDSQQSGTIIFYMEGQHLDRLYAQAVWEQLERVQVMNEPRPVGRTTLLLLKAKPPVILVEVGFMSNSQDLAKLVDPGFRSNVAQALAEGILEFRRVRAAEQSE